MAFCLALAGQSSTGGVISCTQALTVNPAIVLILSAGQQRRRNVGQIRPATKAPEAPAWLIGCLPL
jgi:hypothetical protein